MTAEAKLKPTKSSVDDFIAKIKDESVRDDCYALIKMMQKVTGAPPVLWAAGIIGFGNYHYKYASGHEGDSCLTAFAPRKTNFVIYAFQKEPLMKKLGKHKATKGCVYIKRLADIDMAVLEKLVAINVNETRAKYGS